ncbi:MAG: ImmA/IrrE family metallo-endopeptidase [Acidobacteria bacterium]|nr:ImmA/IrrE family metallo-endopeptidase [Acidobacteriota bacterium]
MIRPDDSLLNASQLATVRRHADLLLRDASAIERFPTPIDDLMAAAKLTIVDDEVLNENFLRQFMKMAKSGIATIKSALSKVLGLYESHDRLVVIDKDAPKPRHPFIKLHEAGHGTLPHQNKVYRFIHDCEKTLDAEITDLFEREANVFASEVLFQGEVFAKEAQDLSFGIKTPMALARKFGASNYATFRRYAITNPYACCVVVLEPSVYNLDGGFTCDVRRVVMSKSFEAIYDGKIFGTAVTDSHPLGPSVPINRKRMTSEREVVLIDRNRDERVCMVEAFNTTHQILVLIRDIGRRSRSGIVLPG